MVSLIPFLDVFKETNDYSEKTQITHALLDMLQKQKRGLPLEDKKALSDFVFGELKAMVLSIPNAANYREKSVIFDYEDALLGVVMTVYPNVSEVPAELLTIIKTVVDVVTKERFLENAVSEMFEKEEISEADAEALVKTVSGISDEFQRGALYGELYIRRKDINKLSDGAKAVIGGYVASEFARYLASDITEDIAVSLEMACDVCRYFINDSIVASLYNVFKLNRNHISFYAVDTLLSAGKDVPKEVVVALANDIVNADMTYECLERYGKTDLFPEELAAPEYLAKSDMVHWLIYPTELGKQPNEIEYLGEIEVKHEIYYIFRFKSDSDTLDGEHKNKWLIGWSSKDGGTFSNFDLYDEYDKGKPEKTLKNIKKKLIG